MENERLLFTQYELGTLRTRGENLTPEEEFVNAALGLAGEAGEVVDHVKKHLFHGQAFDPFAVAEELGDVLFYLTWLANFTGHTLEDIARKNTEKLHKRWPHGFQMSDPAEDVPEDVAAEMAERQTQGAARREEYYDANSGRL